MLQEEQAAPVEEASLTLAQEVAELVREQSKTEGTLTPVGSLEVDGKLLESIEQKELIGQVLAEKQCRDIRLMRTSAGAAYLYSSAHLSDSYARILLRVEEDNPYETIASTVREESEVYPRPTPVDMFRQPIFGLDPDRVEQLVQEMLQLAQYGDVKLLQASTGALYLYSERHLDGEWAQSLVEWEEVGKFQSM